MSHGTDLHPSLRITFVTAMLACLALAAALALATPADAGVRTFRAGVVNGTIPSEGELTEMRRIGVKSVRVVFSWRAIETRRRTGSSCATAVYNFERHDSLVSEAGQRGVSILPVLGGSPDYVEPTSNLRHDGARYPAPGTRAFGDFQCFVRALVGRYGRGGVHLARDIIEWQVWNEPNLPLYSPQQRVSPKKYAQLLKSTAASIRSQDRRASVVLAGLPEELTHGMNSNVFLRKMYRVNGVKAAFDVVALHPYARNALGAKGALIRLRETLKDLGDRRLPIWVTEIGFATDGRKGYFLVTSERGQADKLEAMYRMFRKNRERFKLGTFYSFNFRDDSSYAENTQNWTEYAGLYRKDGTPKPSCARYKAFAGPGGPCARIRDGGSVLPVSTGGFTLGTEASRDAQVVPSAPESP